MEGRTGSSRLFEAVVVILGLAIGPAIASAHGVGTSRFATPLPLSFLFIGAGATVALTALYLSLTGKDSGSRAGCRYVLIIPSEISRTVRHTVSFMFLIVVLAAISTGFTGRQVPVNNLANVFIWPVWFHGVAILAVLVGNPWGMLSPWRTIYDGICHIEGRPLELLDRFPKELDVWPALLGFLILLGVIENLTVIPRSPKLTAVLIAVYTFVMLGGAILYGRTWFRKADPLGVLYGLFGRVAPLEIDKPPTGDYKLVVRPPWRGCLEPVASWQLVVFVIAMVYTVSFDGFTSTSAYQTILFAVRTPMGTGAETSIVLYGVGLVGFVASFGVGIWSVERLGAGNPGDWLTATLRFAPTLLPIAAAYEVAHNYPYVLRNFGQLFTIVSDPIFPGIGAIRLLEWLSLPLFWGSQVTLIVLGHIVAVVAAHYVAIARYDSVSAAHRGHLPLVVLMIGYTVLSLWIISQPIVAG